MLEAAGWGFLAASSLLLGAALATFACPSKRVTGLILGFGAGTLISAISFELTEEAFALGGADALAIGLALGAVTFYLGDRALARRDRTSMHNREVTGDDGSSLLLGAMLDGLPENAVLGTTLIGGTGIGVPVLAAIFLSNLPEGIAGADDMKRAGQPTRKVLALWAAVALACTLASVIGFAVLDGAPDEAVALLQAFAAGGVLAMLAIEMLPEAHEKGGRETGLVTVFGFALAYLLSTL